MNIVTIAITKDNQDNIVEFIELKIKEEFNKNSFNIILNFKNIDFIPSRVISCIASLLKVARSNGGEIILQNLELNVKKIFEITKMYKIIKITENEKESIEFFNNLKN